MELRILFLRYTFKGLRAAGREQVDLVPWFEEGTTEPGVQHVRDRHTCKVFGLT